MAERPYTVASLGDKPRIRVLANGWVRHDGGGMPCVLRTIDRVRIAVRSGNAEFIQGHQAGAYNWPHAGWSGDILYWRPLP